MPDLLFNLTLLEIVWVAGCASAWMIWITDTN